MSIRAFGYIPVRLGMDHGQGVVSIFLHLSKIYVKEDGFVRAGQLVGAIDPVAWRYEGVE